MATAAQHLPTVGVTLQEAHDFIFSHIDQPSIIYNAAIDHGVTIAMLNEITGYSTNDISEYFKSSELIPEKLNDISPFINSDLGIFAHFVNFNNKFVGQFLYKILHAAVIVLRNFFVFP